MVKKTLRDVFSPLRHLEIIKRALSEAYTVFLIKNWSTLRLVFLTFS